MRPDILKDHDSPVGVLFGGRLAARLIPVAETLGVSPTQVTLASLALNLVAAALIVLGVGGLRGLVASSLIAAGFVLDCLDGQLARATGRVSDFGRYLDSLTDLIKVFALILGLTLALGRGGGGEGTVLVGAAAFFGYLLCEYHVQLARQLPQRPQLEYERQAAPWKRRLRFRGQTIDVAFAIGEVLLVIALAAAAGRPLAGLAVLAAATPIQFLSYSIRFWKLRYAAPGRREPESRVG